MTSDQTVIISPYSITPLISAMEMQSVSEGHTGSDEMSMVSLPVLKLTGDQNAALTKRCMEKQNALDGESSVSR